MIKALNMDNLMDGLFGSSLSAAASTQSPAPAAEKNSDTSRKVVMLPLDEIYDKPNHTFTVNREAPEWPEFVSSIRLYGIQTPILVRHKPCELGAYECIAGHRRRTAAEEVGLTSIPAIITDVTDSESNVLMIITNKQRTKWTTSETAHSWKELYSELKQQGQRTDLMQRDSKSAETLMEELSGQDIRSVQRTIKLCDLISPLLALVDARKLPTGVAYHLSFLSAESQSILYDLIKTYGTIKPEDAQYFRNLEESGNFNSETACIYMEFRQPQKPFKLTEKEIRNWFPSTYDGDKKALIKQLLDGYFSNQQSEG